MTARRWDVVVVGGANVDYLVKGERLPRPGETVDGRDFQEAAGGKGANQAVAAARLGARTAFVARLGADARAETILAGLQAEGVDRAFVQRAPGAGTGVALISVDASGEKQIHVYPGANAALGAADVRAAETAIAGAAVLLVQLEVPMEAVLQAARLARQAGARVVLDPAPPATLPDELLPLVDVVRGNAAEAEALTGVRVTDAGSAGEAARRLRGRGARAAIVQAGGEGNLLSWDGGERLFPRLKVHSVDATGAGDAFAAALAAELAAGRAIDEAARFANAAAAFATTKVGAQAGLPRREDVLALL